MSNPLREWDWDELTKAAQDGLKGAGATVEAMRRFVESSDKYSKRLVWLTGVLVVLTIVLVVLTAILVGKPA